jgi:hypothetical protein
MHSSITSECVAPRIGRGHPEAEYPAYVRCFARVTGPRSEIWYPSWALRVGYVLNAGLRSVVPESLSKFEFGMFDVTGMTPDQYALEGMYTHASTFENGEVKVVNPRHSDIAGQVRNLSLAS